MNIIFRKYLEEAIGCENALVAFSALESPASVSVRMNPFKQGASFDGIGVAWNRHGRFLDSRPQFTLDPCFHAGAYYVQDSSSMFVGHVFRRILETMNIPEGRPVRVLDLCAAPGGKTTDLAASLREKFGDGYILVANEVMKQRVGILADNVALWGDPNVIVTSDDPRDFASMEGLFDLVVADVPCSGEGMFRKDEQAVEQWSADNVSLCQARQRRIVADMWPCLASGGVLIYSTCTFNRMENDDNVQWAASELGADIVTSDDVFPSPGVIKTTYGYSLVPGFVDGEGQYCAALKKTSDIQTVSSGTSEGGKRKHSQKASPEMQKLPQGMEKLFKTPMSLRMKGDMITAIPLTITADLAFVQKYLHVIAAGCAVGQMKAGSLIPDADLALSISLSSDAFPSVEVDRQMALSFLHRDTFALQDMPKGYLIIRHRSLALGFVKNLGNRCNNLHPQSRRIRMDVKDK